MAGSDGETKSDVIPFEAHLETVLQRAEGIEGKLFWQEVVRDMSPTLFHAGIKGDSDLQPQFLCKKSNMSLASASTFCKSSGVTLQSLGLACWSLTLPHYAQSLDVCFGLVLSGRTTECADSLVFPTFNTVLFRNRIGGSETLADFVRKTHEQVINTSEHQHFPLRETLKLGGNNGPQQGIFDTLFTFQKVPNTDSAGSQLYHEIDIDAGSGIPPYSVNVEMEGRGNALWWTIATQARVMDSAGVNSVLVTIEHVLEALVNQSNSAVFKTTDKKVSICGLDPIALTKDNEIFKRSQRYKRHWR